MVGEFHVAILGATGAVGNEMLGILESRKFPVARVKLLASARSAGQNLLFAGKAVRVEEATESSFEDVDLCLFSAGASRSRQFARIAVTNGARVVDNSSAFRMDPDVPLVVPEINGDEIKDSSYIVSVPNCSAIVLLMAVAPLRKLGMIDRIIVSTYQSASGGGAALMRDLEDQTRAAVSGGVSIPKVSSHPYAFNLFSHNTAINEFGYNEEEWKVIEESRKILADPGLKLNVTCVRVPVLRAHSESITVEFEGAAPSEDAVREVLAAAAGVRVIDDRASNHFPMPLEASGQDEVLVGRIRKDVSNPNAICLFACGDQLRKGAALSAVQIAEILNAKGLIRTRSAT